MSIASPLPAVLVVDDDLVTREMSERIFRRGGWRVAVAATGRDGLARVAEDQFDLILLDFCLPDMLGTAFVRQLPGSWRQKFFLISGFVDVAVAVEAMRLGAAQVLEKPVDLFDVLELADRMIGRCEGRSSYSAPLGAPPGAPSGVQSGTSGHPPIIVQARARAADPPLEPHSIADRWASYVLRACEAEGDFRTIGGWADLLGVSYSSLCEHCRLAGVSPFAARDFARMLRAVRHAASLGCGPETLLDVADRRTLNRLFQRAGVSGHVVPATVSDFLARQEFLPADSPVVRAVMRLVHDHPGPPSIPSQ